MSNTRKKQIAIGVEDFKEIIDKGSYFVDKTLIIKKVNRRPSEGYFVYSPKTFRQDTEPVHDPPLFRR